MVQDKRLPSKRIEQLIRWQVLGSRFGFEPELAVVFRITINEQDIDLLLGQSRYAVFYELRSNAALLILGLNTKRRQDVALPILV